MTAAIGGVTTFVPSSWNVVKTQIPDLAELSWIIAPYIYTAYSAGAIETSTSSEPVLHLASKTHCDFVFVNGFIKMISSAFLAFMVFTLVLAIQPDSSCASASYPTAKTLATRDCGFASVRRVIEVEVNAHLENVAVRSSGDLLITRVDKPYLYLVNPENNTHFLITEFANATSTLGIAEYQPVIFAVCVGSSDVANFKGIVGSWAVMSIDLNTISGQDIVVPKQIANIPQAGLLNGAAFRAPDIYYAADSQLGMVWSVNLTTAEVAIAVPNHPLLASVGAMFGINGLRWSENEQVLFFTNTALGIIGKIPLLSDESFGAPVQLTSSLTNVSVGSWDDMAIDKDGAIFATTGNGNTINYVSADGELQQIVAGSKNSTLVAGPTAAQFGRTESDSNVLYISSMGSAIELVNGTKVGGGVLALDLSSWTCR